MQEHFFSDGFNDEYRRNGSGTSAKQQNSSRLFICGTNAYNPRCRYYKMWHVKENWEEENDWPIILEKEFCIFEK